MIKINYNSQLYGCVTYNYFVINRTILSVSIRVDMELLNNHTIIGGKSIFFRYIGLVIYNDLYFKLTNNRVDS